VAIHDNTGTSTEYYNYVPNPRLDLKPSPNRGGTDAERGIKRPRPVRSDVLDKMLRGLDARDKAKHNPIVSITRVVLDPTDGDFSLTINGKDHLWIDGEAIIVIADYIEQKLKIEVKKEILKPKLPESITEFTRDMFNLNNKVKISLGGNPSITYDVARDLKEIIDKKHPDWKIVKKIWGLDEHPTHYILDVRGFNAEEFVEEILEVSKSEHESDGGYLIHIENVNGKFVNWEEREVYSILWNQRCKFFSRR